MSAQWSLVTAPILEPLTLTEAKLQAKITQTNDDSLITSYIQAAREAAETCLARGLITQTWKLELDRWADVIFLPMAAPLQSVTTVKYYDTAGVQQTLATSGYTVDTGSRPGRVVRAPDQSWPALQADRLSSAVVITYVVGWTTAALVPERIKQGLRLHVTYMDCDREGLSEYGERARQAAEACWDDRVRWIEPGC